MDRDVLRHSLLGATIVVGIVAVLGSLRAGALPGNGDSWMLGVVAVVDALLGWAVIERRRDLGIGWLMLVGGFLAAATATSAWWAYESLVLNPSSLPFERPMAWLSVWLPATSIPLVLVAPLVLMPNGATRSPFWRRFLVLSGATILVLTIATAVVAVPVALRNPLELLDVPGTSSGSRASLAITLQAIGRSIGLLAAVVSLGGLAIARRRSSGDVTRQYTTVLLGAAVFVGSMLVSGLIVWFSGGRVIVPEAVQALFWLSLPTSIAVAVARFGLYDLRVLISRSGLVLASGTAIVVLYLGVMVVVAHLLDDPATLSVSSALAACAIALAVAPTVAASRRLVRRGFGRAADTTTIAERYGDHLALDMDADGASALLGLAETLRAEYRLASVELVIEHLPGARVGVRNAPAWHVALRHGREEIGEMIVSTRRGEALARKDLRSLEGTGHYVAVAARAMRVSDELRRSQQHVQDAHTEVRRRVRRDLHDGVGPLLAMARLKLTALRRQLPQDCGIDDTIDQISDAVRELRRVVDGLQPSVLEDLGLVPALRMLIADTGTTATLNVALEAPSDLADLEPHVAVTAYRIIGECLANVVRHSRAASCAISLDRSDGFLNIEVSDNGTGFDPESTSGMGLRSIGSRALGAGGRATMDSRIGAGTTVKVKLPT